MKYELKPKSFSRTSDDELLRRLKELVQQSRRVEADLVAHIGEAEERRLYARYASSMFRSNFTPEP
jgi:flagellar motor switch protein FliM